MALVTTTPTTTHLFGCLYQLNSEAQEELVQKFRVNSSFSHISCEFHDGYFIVQCSKENEALVSTFSLLLQEFIRTESSRGLDIFEEPRITRIAGTEAKSREKASKNHISLDLGIGPSDLDLTSPIISDSAMLINHESVIRSWSSIDKGGLLKNKLRDKILDAVGSLCNSRLEYAEDSSEVQVMADSEADVARVFTKLSTIDKAERSECPYICGYAILESQFSVKLQLTTDTSILLPRNLAILRSIRSPLVISMVIDGKIELINRSKREREQEQALESEECLLWRDCPLQPFGILPESHKEMQYTGALNDLHRPDVTGTVINQAEPGPTSAVSEWLHHNDSCEHEDPFKPSHEVQEVSEETSHTLQPSVPQSEKPTTKRTRAARGAIKGSTVMVSANDLNQSRAIQEKPDHHMHGELINIDPPDQAPPVSSAPKIEPPFIPSAIPTQDYKRTPPKFSETKTNGTLEQAAASWTENAITLTSKGLLIDVAEGDPRSKPEMKCTMRQGKPVKNLNSSSETLKAFDKEAARILHLALHHPGSMKLEVSIGRLILDAETVSGEYRRPFTWAQRSSTLPKDWKTYFSPGLSTRSSDIKNILDLKLPHGRRLFVEEPQARSVTYVVSCLTKSRDKVMIEVGQDGTFQLRWPRSLLGAIDWHFPLRFWDARLQLSNQVLNINDYQQQQAQKLIDSMRVIASSDQKSLEFLATTDNEGFTIESVILRRETSHKSHVYPDLLLHLIEFQDVSVARVPGLDNSRGAIHVPAKASKLWWQASVSSITADNKLRENESLELGETAKWSAEEIVSHGVVRDMHALSNEIVTRIDNVGLHNYEAKGHSGSKTTTKTRTSQHKSSQEGPRETRGFW